MPVKYGGSILKAIKAAGGEGWFPYYPDATKEAVAEARALDLKVGAWTVNAPSDMRILAARGLDALCTDRPDILRRDRRLISELSQSAPASVDFCLVFR